MQGGGGGGLETLEGGGRMCVGGEEVCRGGSLGNFGGRGEDVCRGEEVCRGGEPWKLWREGGGCV